MSWHQNNFFPVNLFHVDLLINTALFSSSNYGQFSTNVMQNKQLSLQETLKYISTCKTCRIPPPLLSLVWRWWYGALPFHGKESGLAEGVSALLHCEHWVAHLLGPGVHHLCHHHIPVATSLLVRMHGRMDMHLHCSVFRSTEIFLIHHHTCMYIYMFSNSMSTLEKKHATLSQGDLYRTYRLF